MTRPLAAIAAESFAATARILLAAGHEPASEAALARIVDEAPSNFHAAVSGQRPPGLDRVAGWLRIWNASARPRLALYTDGDIAELSAARPFTTSSAKPPLLPVLPGVSVSSSFSASRTLFRDVQPAHVLAAVESVKEGGVPPREEARHTFLIHDGKEYPAKLILRRAYEIATGLALAATAHTGGSAAARELRQRGFTVNEGTVNRPTARPAAGPSAARMPVRAAPDAEPRSLTAKDRLFAALVARFGPVAREATLPGLATPADVAVDPELAPIHNALAALRGHDGFSTPGFAPRFDFLVPGLRVLIEVDERQHFTAPRAASLAAYPSAARLGFDRDQWIRRCNECSARDNDPPFRDEQRAFYDSVRDLIAPRLGYAPPIRIHIDDLATPEGIEGVVKRVAASRPGTTQPLHVVTVAIEGSCARSEAENPSRVRMLQGVVREVGRRRWNCGVLLLPGGTFKLPAGIHLGPLSHEQRVAILAAQSWAGSVTESASTLSAVIVFGVDGESHQRAEFDDADWGDQLCVAWGPNGPLGVGRKAFPTRGDEADGYVVYAPDIDSPHRLAPMPAGGAALLCSCYDAYATEERPESPGARQGLITWLGDGDRLLDRGAAPAVVARKVRERIPGWCSLVDGCRVVLAAVHGFSASGPGSGKGYWQRHGIERSSRYAGGRSAFGAAHFERLPDPQVCTLAAQDGERLNAIEAFVQPSSASRPAALVRRFGPV